VDGVAAADRARRISGRLIEQGQSERYRRFPSPYRTRFVCRRRSRRRSVWLPIPEAAQLARLLRRQVEQPEVLRRKRSLGVHERQTIWNESIPVSVNSKPDCRQFDLGTVCSNGRSGASTLTLAPVYTIRSPDGDHTGSRAAPAANRTGLPRPWNLEQPRSTLVDAARDDPLPIGDQQIDPEYQSDPPAIGDRRLLPTRREGAVSASRPQDYSHFTPIGRDRRGSNKASSDPFKISTALPSSKRHRPSPVPCEDK